MSEYRPQLEIMRKEKMRSDDRILKIRQKAGMKPKSGTGLVDPQLFTGGNQLHAIRDPMTCLWYFKYERGVLPDPLKKRWTNWNAMLHFATTYFNKRNLEIVEVLD